MKIGRKTKLKGQLITAEQGKVLRRKLDGKIFGKQITLGKRFWENGKKLETPIVESPDDYEDIEEPVITEEQPLIGALSDIIAEIPVEEKEVIEAEESILEPEENTPEEKKVIYISDIILLQEQIKEIRQTIMNDLLTMQDTLNKVISVLSDDQRKQIEMILK
jgi:hypothetical protein